MLFLDEVHRLSAEGRRSLYPPDRGEIYRVGDTAQGRHPVSARLVFATTEDTQHLSGRLLLRRIPIQVNLPDLQHRSRREKE